MCVRERVRAILTTLHPRGLPPTAPKGVGGAALEAPISYPAVALTLPAASTPPRVLTQSVARG
jgi:hypothetical protein